MKRVYITFLLSLFLLSNTEVRQLLKLSELFSHFKEHQLIDEDLSFTQFLYIHYVVDDQDNNDQSRDEALPFKSTEGWGAMDIQYSIPSIVKVENQIASAPVLISHFHSALQGESNGNNIWQPPEIL